MSSWVALPSLSVRWWMMPSWTWQMYINDSTEQLEAVEERLSIREVVFQCIERSTYVDLEFYGGFRRIQIFSTFISKHRKTYHQKDF